MGNYKRLLSYIKPYRGLFIFAFICMLGVGLMTSASAWIVRDILDEIFIKKDRDMLKIIPAVVMGIFILQGIFMYVQSYIMAHIGQRIVMELRNTLYSQIQLQPLSFFGKNPTGTLMARITYDINLVSSSVSNGFSSMLRETCTMVFLLGVLFYTDVQLAIISVIFYPLAMYPIVRMGKRMRKVGTLSQEAMGNMNTFLHETISGARIVKAFGMEQHEIKRFAEVNKNFFTLEMKSLRVKALSRPIMEILSALAIAAIIWYGGSKVMADAISTGDFFSFMTALLMLYKPVKQLSMVNNTIQTGMSAATRIFEIIDTEPEIKDRNGAETIGKFENSIEFENISFSYGDQDIIKGFNLTVKKGTSLAIVGGSGAGKSTISNLIPRFYDVTAGRISIDNKDIRDITVSSLRAIVSIVTQETILFNDTVQNNIAYGTRKVSEEDIVNAATAAFADDFIRRLPEGYGTIIGENGTKLSGGQRQRIAIARAILKDSPILILDEATSALDTESEKLVQEALNNLMKGRTSFVIAHRLSTIHDADRIIVMEKGEIIEEGCHDELIMKKGKYKQLYSAQFKSVEGGSNTALNN